MAFIRRASFVVAVFVFLTASVSVLDASRLKRQASGDVETPQLQDIQNLAGLSNDLTSVSHGGNFKTIMEGLKQALGQDDQEQTVDLNSIMQMAHSVQQTGEHSLEFTLSEGRPNDPDNPEVSVIVETLTAEDLMSTDRGRQQLSQLSAQLDQAMNSINQGVQMMQGPEQIDNGLQNPSAGSMLFGIVSMLTGDESGNMLLNLMGVQTSQAVNQAMQAVDQLTNLKNVLGRIYQLVQHFQTNNPSAAKDIQKLITSAIMSLQQINGGVDENGQLIGVESMLGMALNGLKANLDLLDGLAREMNQSLSDPIFLLFVNDTNCFAKTLTGNLSTSIGVGCVQHLMNSMSMVNDSQHMITSLMSTLTKLMNNPHLTQSFGDFMKMPNLEKAFVLMEMLMGDMQNVKSDLFTAMQTVQAMLRSLLNNQPLLETLSNLLQNPESNTVYENVMDFLHNASIGDPSTQQVLSVVNDTISSLWQDGNAQQAAEKIQEILTELENNQDASQPLNEAQQALVDLLNKLMEVAQNAANNVTATTQRPSSVATTLAPTDSTKKDVHETSRSPVSTTTPTLPATSTAGDAQETPLPPHTTPRSDTNDGNGSTCISLSLVTILFALFALKI